MSKPEIKIVVALLEGYISQRYEKNWHLKETDDQKTTLPTDANDQKKIDSLVNLLHAMPSEESKKHGKKKQEQIVRRWMHFLNVLHQEELAQAKVGWWKDFLAQTMRTVRSYILEELNENTYFLQKKAELEAAVNSAVTAEDKSKAQLAVDALNYEPGLLNSYFAKNMLGYDAKTIELQEADVAAFKANAMDETKRPTTYVSRLLRTFPKKSNAAETAEDDVANDNNVTEKQAESAEENDASSNPAPAEDPQRKLARRLAQMANERQRHPKGSAIRYFKPSTSVGDKEVEVMSRNLRRVQGKIGPK